MAESFHFNDARGRYELDVDGTVAYADIRRQGQTLYIDYVYAPPVLRGTGAAGRLMEKVAAIAQDDRLEIHPICGYAATWLRRHQK